MKVMIYVYLNRKKEKKTDCTRLAIENVQLLWNCKTLLYIIKIIMSVLEEESYKCQCAVRTFKKQVI